MDNRLDPSWQFLRPQPGARWDLTIQDGIAELFFGSGSTFPQYAAIHLDAIAIPTLVATPCPNGPVVVSTPDVRRYSGCPGHLLSN